MVNSTPSAARGVPRSAVVRLTPTEQLPWWWDGIHLDQHLCNLDYVPLQFLGKHSREVSSRELPFFLLKLLKELMVLRRTYDCVYTVECDFSGLGIAFWQSLLFMKRPRHVILQFIMREKTHRLSSRLKYVLMKFMFRSVHRIVCSSRAEAQYYREVFGWNVEKAQFVPFFTSHTFLEDPDPNADGNYLLAAGRVFRDYRTAIDAVRGTSFRLIIVGAVGVAREIQGDEQVDVREEIPLDDFVSLIRHAAAVVVPLVDVKISAGQTVLLQAMAMGKLVIATRTAGTQDYIDHMVDGVLVAPADVEEMRRAMRAAADHELRRKLGGGARRRVARRHLPHHYSAGIRRAVPPAAVGPKLD